MELYPDDWQLYPHYFHLYFSEHPWNNFLQKERSPKSQLLENVTISSILIFKFKN